MSESNGLSDVAQAPQPDRAAQPGTLIDPRGPRFAAAVTVVVLAVALVTIPSVTSVVLLFLQALAFGAAALFGIKAQPYGWFFRKVLAPRLGRPRELEDGAPPRFAQTVGLFFVVVAMVALSIPVETIAQIAVAFALAAAFLNAVFNFCLGCEIYLLIQRIRHRRATPADAADSADSADSEAHTDSGDDAVDVDLSASKSDA